jgi:hypothetical protein
MVVLHELEAGNSSNRATADADAVVEVRGVAGATRSMAELLLTLGWTIDDADIDIEGHGYTFRRAPSPSTSPPRKVSGHAPTSPPSRR